MMREKLEAALVVYEATRKNYHDSDVMRSQAGFDLSKRVRAALAARPVEAKADAGEPVAWMRYLQGDVFQCDKDRDDAFPVYARPAPADALREDHL